MQTKKCYNKEGRKNKNGKPLKIWGAFHLACFLEAI
jgi:hypothetical protein